jgi:hypothetical protein
MRNVESRLIKLEARRQRPNEILLIWRWPDADVKAATNGARFAPGDRVICLEWFGDGPLPAPRWYRDRLTSEFGVTEKESLDRSVDRVGEDGRQPDPGFADIPHVPAGRLRELPDNDLLHMIFGIGT